MCCVLKMKKMLHGLAHTFPVEKYIKKSTKDAVIMKHKA